MSTGVINYFFLCSFSKCSSVVKLLAISFSRLSAIPKRTELFAGQKKNHVLLTIEKLALNTSYGYGSIYSG